MVVNKHQSYDIDIAVGVDQMLLIFYFKLYLQVDLITVADMNDCCKIYMNFITHYILKKLQFRVKTIINNI